MEAKIQSGEFEMVRRYYICSLRRKNETPFHEIIITFLFLLRILALGPKKFARILFFGPEGRKKSILANF